ncbi:hypothetical protein BLA60_17765 [Actinophytocola xinjiangensis]|uniref:Thioesterase domain-containing protein n=2 Tax=Actinophytocola xinjiangensis TaxID=485602 RepID=A0A7Z0WKQ1_9PSEU|nr:hypothetical protein BLA60_17765 [Actinophytocola xinjiangensis]
MDVSVRMVFEAPTPARLARSLVIGDVRNAFDPVYPIRESGSSEPLFCLPAGSGLAWTYSGLMRVLDPEIPIYGLQSPALAKHRRRPASLEAVAAEYVSRIREVRPHGPYRLLGWSFGGVLAHAVAVRLQASGERVELLAVLDVDLVPNPDLMGKPVPEEFLRYRDDADDAGIGGLTVGDPGESAALGVLTTEEQSIVANARRYHREIRSRHAGGVFDGDLLFVLATADKSPIVPAEQIWRPFVTGNITELHVDCTHYELLDMAALARPDQPASGAAIEQVGAALNKVLTSD